MYRLRQCAETSEVSLPDHRAQLHLHMRESVLPGINLSLLHDTEVIHTEWGRDWTETYPVCSQAFPSLAQETLPIIFSASFLLINKPQGKSEITNAPEGPFITALSEPNQLQVTTPIAWDTAILCVVCMKICACTCVLMKGAPVYMCVRRSSGALYCSPS